MTKKVRVIKGRGTHWYNDHIGEVFNVMDSSLYDYSPPEDDVYYVDHPENTTNTRHFVEKSDCEIVTDPDTLDLIANLSRRVAELERNVTTLNAKTEMALDDIVMLDERTQGLTEAKRKTEPKLFTVDEIIRGVREFSENKPKQTRDDIVKRAIADVAEIKRKLRSEEYQREYDILKKKGHQCIKFAVNRDKRTVVALLRNAYYGDDINAKGIAKCAPNDVFNAHIGKAIAVRRALGLEVPTEYTNAPKPEGVRVGDIVRGNEISGYYAKDKTFTLAEKVSVKDAYYYTESNKSDYIYVSQIDAIIDDTTSTEKAVRG